MSDEWIPPENRQARMNAKLPIDAIVPGEGPEFRACRVCGLAVKPGPNDVETPLNIWTARTANRFREPGRDGREVRQLEDQRWRHRHASCSTDWADVFGEVLSITGITSLEGELILDAARGSGVPLPAAAPSQRTARRRRFDFVSRDERDELRKLAVAVLATTRPTRCADGACSACGVAKSVGWVTGPLSWSDGSRAPLCGDCAQWWEMYSQPAAVDGMPALRAVMLAGLCGVRPSQWSEPRDHGLRMFAELARDDERAGYAEPWSYRRDALQAVRMSAWKSNPAAAPPLVREAIERRRRVEAARAREEHLAADRAADPATALPW